MRKHIAQVVAIATFAAFSLAAQGGPGRFDHAGGPGMPGGPAQNSADAIARRVEFLTALLTLTSAQASQTSTIFTNAAAAVTPIQTNLSAARTSLAAAVKANNAAQIDQLATQIGTFEGQMIAAQSKAEASFYALLTAEQKTRYDAVGPRGPGRGR